MSRELTVDTTFIDQLIQEKKLDKPTFDLTIPMDLLVMTRMAYFEFQVPLETYQGRPCTENQQNNCLIEMYVFLRDAGRIVQSKTLLL